MFVATRKSISVAPSSRGVGTLSSAGVWTGSTVAYSSANGGSDLGTGRRIIISASAVLDLSLNFTIYGTRDGGGTIIETVQGSSTGAAVSSTQDFLTVTLVSASSTPFAAPAYFGTNTVAGTPWQRVDVSRNPINLGFSLILSSSRASMTNQLDYTLGISDGVSNGSSVAYYPWPYVSTSVTSLTAYSTISSPITAWRLTLTSTSLTEYAVITALQAGMP